MKELPEFEYDLRIGRVLTRWRKEKKITQSEMADLIGTARQSIINIEKGNTHTKSYTIYKWAKITKQNPDTVYDEIEDQDRDYDDLLKKILSGTRNFTKDMLEAVGEIMTERRGNLRAILNVFVMYLRCPMRDRANLTLLILNCYKAELARGDIVKKNFMPDIELVQKYQESGMNAWINGKDKYEEGD